MAQAVITKIIDGERNAVFHVFFEGDGLGELVDFVLIDPATSFGVDLPSEPTLTVEKLMYDLSGFNAKLEFDYLATDTPVWSLSGGSGTELDFCKYTGIKDRSEALDGSGKLTITTSGLGLGDFGSLIVQVRKN